MKRLHFVFQHLFCYAFATVLLFGAVAAPVGISTAEAAVPKFDNIRVALFMNHKKSNSESSVTLASSGGYDIGIRTALGTKVLTSLADQAISASADGYGVLLLETADQSQAKTLAGKLSSPTGKALVFAETKMGKTSYRVVYGRYNKQDEAASARDAVVKDPAVAALIGQFVPRLTGPLRLGTAPTADKAAAEKQLTAVQKAGYNAVLTLSADGSGKTLYAVHVGNEPDAASLQKLQADAAKALSGTALQPVSMDKPYLLLREDGFLSTTAAAASHIVLSGAAAGKLWIHPKQAGVTVKERFDRKYRGDLELSLYNNELAVVNELPMDEYIYSVVGAEMGGSYPLEALKAQAVVSRTYALMNGTPYDIAQVVDNTFDQAYYGMSFESDDVVAAVNATHGEVVVDTSGELAATFYSASAGGKTADTSEVWKSAYPYLKSVPSPDEGMNDKWYRVLLQDGRTGYVNGNYVQETGQKNGAGYAYLSVTDPNLNVRSAPSTFASLGMIITKLNAGDRVVALETVNSKTPYVWERTYTAAELAALLVKNGTALTGALTKLEVTQRGPSGRATEVKANGLTIKASSPDSLRTVLGSLPSTLFDIVETGRYTIKGAGQSREKADGAPVYALSASGKASQAAAGQYYVVGADSGSVRAITSENKYVFHGQGYGHGMGMSQYGARNYALQGLTYDKIIKAYYSGVNIVKD